MSGAPTMEAVFAALERLRLSDDALARAHDAEYRVLDSWLRSHGSAAERSDDVIQQSLLSVARAVGRMEATTPKRRAPSELPSHSLTSWPVNE